MDVNTFADWSIVLLGAALCLMGLAVVCITLFVQLSEKEGNRDIRWSPLLIAAVLLFAGIALLENFDTLSDETEGESSQIP